VLEHEIYMKRCLELAGNGRGSVSPNPLVGCVIVYEGTIIGEGWHNIYGGPHAEVNAINQVSDHGFLSKSTLYVNLEPCSHWGKTPPCADLIIEKKIPRVVIGSQDAHTAVDGKGILKLREAGIEVTVGVLEEEATKLNARFFTFQKEKRPYIILKWAQTRDGFLARPDYTSKWITTPASRMLVHQWRAEEDAVMVGTNTALYDNPQLTCRAAPGEDPMRLVIDRQGRLPQTHYLFDGCAPTFVFTEKPFPNRENVEAVTDVHFMDELFVKDMQDWMYGKNIQSVIIEGGAHLLQTFIAADAWDEARVFTGDIFFGEGIAAPDIKTIPSEVHSLGTDDLSIFYRIAKPI
jgi:diaminohydroxyphosphoribosylaminopyrimidine deaminase/5-amino-6-(5-phosphoribosylamino)uracil reductase